MRVLTPRFVAAAALVVVPLAACNGGGETDDGEGTSSGSETPPEGAVQLEATDQLTFEPDTVEAEAGEVTFVLVQTSQLAHSLRIEGVDASEFRLEVQSSGATDTGSFELEPGEYELFCDVPGHESVMRAQLTVE